MARLDGTVPRGKFAYIYIIVFIYFALVSPELMGSMSEPNKMARLKDVTNPQLQGHMTMANCHYI